MVNLTVECANANVEALDAEIRAALASTAVGIRWDGREITVYLSDEATLAQLAEAREIVEKHDPARLTPRQQAEQEQQERLDALRAANATALDESVYAAAPENLKKLASRVAWLEQEILALRQGV